MSREKLADVYMLSVKEMTTVLYTSALSEHYSKAQITLVVEEILKAGFREVYLESVDLLLTEEDITAIHLFQTKYAKKTNALKVLITSKAQEIEDKIDFEAILEKLDFKE
tara:strand:- start:6380 stop:6709 length:330 start_codon:yes stop_codon:yes gene_type:complete